MNCDRYSLTVENEGWALSLNHQVLESGMDQACAERAAEVAARLSVQRGRTAVVTFDDGREVAFGDTRQMPLS